MRRILVVLGIVTLMCMTLLVAPVSAATLTVAADGTGDYTSLLAALNAASSGDTIYIQRGVYSESAAITISKNNIIITGDGADKVTLDMSRKSMTITGSGCRIENLKFRNSSILKPASSASNCIIRDNIFELGFIESHSSYNLIFNNIFLNPSASNGGINIAGEATFNDVRNNVIIGATGSTASATISGQSNFFENNTIRDGSKRGLAIYSTATNNTIASNSFINNPTAGIILYSADSDNKIYLNTFSGNGDTVSYSGSKPSNIFWVSPNSVNYTYNNIQQSGVVGNYWGSNYSGTDFDNNGIGDTSYIVPNSLGSDTAPLMGIWQDGNILSPSSVKPAAGFTASSFAGQAPFTVQFTGWSSGPGTVTSYLWSLKMFS